MLLVKPNDQLITQRPSKVPTHHRDKPNTLPKELEKHNTIKQTGSSQQDKPVYDTTYSNTRVAKLLGFIFEYKVTKCNIFSIS